MLLTKPAGGGAWFWRRMSGYLVRCLGHAAAGRGLVIRARMVSAPSAQTRTNGSQGPEDLYSATIQVRSASKSVEFKLKQLSSPLSLVLVRREMGRSALQLYYTDLNNPRSYNSSRPEIRTKATAVSEANLPGKYNTS